VKQRVAIARAFVNDPALILADEPTANLDSKIGHEVMNLLRRIAKDQGRSGVIVSHDQRIRDVAERDGETFFFCSRGCREEFLGGLVP
jgi:putative ABC transport system ATP-binding protein